MIPGVCDRRHRLGLPTTLLGRSLLRVQDWVASTVASLSVFGDPPIYAPVTFRWVPELEAGWPKIRAELDHVMTYRDQMPSFHEILKEVSTITTDEPESGVKSAWSGHAVPNLTASFRGSRGM